MNLPDFEIRIQQLFDDQLTEEQFAELETELQENPEAMDLYLSYSGLESDLKHHASYQATAEQLRVVPVEELLAQQRRRAIRISLLSAAAIVMILGVIMWLTNVSPTPDTLATVQVTPGSDYSLTHNTDDKAPAGNVMVENSRIVLRHGAVELKLPHDVRAIIEAPAEVALRDEKTLELNHGRALFQVNSKTGRGFTVVTPHQHIVDLGTAFGIDCPNGNNKVELHVLEGKVRVDDQQGNKGEIIKASRSVLLAGTRIQRDLDGPPAAFLHNLPPKIDMLVKEDFDTGLLVGHNYVIRMDKNVIRDLDGKNFQGIDDDTTWNFTSLSNAAPAIITPTSEVATSQFGDWIDTIDGTGLSDRGTSGDILSETHAAGGSNNFALFPSGPDFTGEAIIFTLGAPFTVNQVHLWLNNSSWGTITGFDLEFSSDGGRTFPTTVTGITFDLSLDLSKAQTRTFAEQSGVTHIRLSNIVVTGGDQRFAGFNEIRFGKPESNVDNRFSEWIALFPSVGAQTGFDDDPDCDRLSNGLEAQFGTHPGQPTPTQLPNPTPALGKRDNSPPVFIATYPADDSTNARLGAQLKMLFNEPIKLGSGRVFIQNVTNWDESMLVVGDHRLSIDDKVLTINPPIELKEGTQGVGWLAGWQTDAPVTFLNPRGDGTWYNNDDLQDDNPSLGMSESMRSPGMTSINQPIRRKIGTITADSHYTVSAAIGVRAKNAKNPTTFPGYTIRLVSGDTVLAQLTSDTPPGPANSVNTVGFSWDATTLPKEVNPGDPLSIEIIPNQTSGYLDLNALRISALGQAGK